MLAAALIMPGQTCHASQLSHPNSIVPGESRHWREAQSCGVACGFLLARLLGYPATYEDAVAAIPIEHGGTSLEALRAGLGKLGVDAAVVRGKPADLDRLRMPVIVHTLSRRESPGKTGHYLLVLNVSDRFVQYIEPNYAASIEKITRNDFFRLWSGYMIVPERRRTAWEWSIDASLCLLFGATVSALLRPVACRRIIAWSKRFTRPVATAAGAFFLSYLVVGCVDQSSLAISRVGAEAGTEPAEASPDPPCPLVVWNTEADVGYLRPDGVATGRFLIENQGDQAVRLDPGTPSCRCTRLELATEILAPHEQTTISMSLRSNPHAAGPARAQVYLGAPGWKWAETLRIRGVQLGARFEDYKYVVQGPRVATPAAARGPTSRAATVIGHLYVKDARTVCRLEPSLSESGLERALEIRDVTIGPPVQFEGYVERRCSFTVALLSQAVPSIRRRTQLPVRITSHLGAERMTNNVTIDVWPPDFRPADFRPPDSLPPDSRGATDI